MTKLLIVMITKDMELFSLIKYILSSEGYDVRYLTKDQAHETLPSQSRATAVLVDFRDVSFVANALEELHAWVPSPTDASMVAMVPDALTAQVYGLMGSGVTLLPRPIDPRRLIDVLRAIRWPAVTKTVDLAYGDIEVSTAQYLVHRAGILIPLARIEFYMLTLMLRQPEIVISRDDFVASVWPPNVHVGPRTVDVHMARLRKALNTGGKPNVIRTLRGIGYALTRETPK